MYPELVIRGEGGSIDGVRYDELAPMLLNEMQQQGREHVAEVNVLKEQLVAQASRLARVEAQLMSLQAQSRTPQAEGR